MQATLQHSQHSTPDDRTTLRRLGAVVLVLVGIAVALIVAAGVVSQIVG